MIIAELVTAIVECRHYEEQESSFVYGRRRLKRDRELKTRACKNSERVLFRVRKRTGNKRGFM